LKGERVRRTDRTSSPTDWTSRGARIRIKKRQRNLLGREKRSKTRHLKIHKGQIIAPEGIPEGARFKSEINKSYEAAKIRVLGRAIGIACEKRSETYYWGVHNETIQV
jgi:hypothetical protein